MEPMLESARRFGTPQYFLEADQLRSIAAHFVQTMQTSVPRSHAFYALKSNDLPALGQIVHQQGLQADVAGLFELQLALELGFGTILFSSPGKTREELELALQHPNRVILIVDNLSELKRIIDLARAMAPPRPLRIGFRLCAAPSEDPSWSKFGIPIEQLRYAIDQAQTCPNLTWCGLHVHSSWNKTPEKYINNIETIAAWLADQPSSVRQRMSFLDLGGGFYPEGQAVLHKAEDKGILLQTLASRLGSSMTSAKPAFDPYACTITAVEPLHVFAQRIGDSVRRRLEPIIPNIQIFFEPGRYIASHPTHIVLSVLAVKPGGAIVDGGSQMLGDDRFFEYCFAPIVNVTRPSRERRRFTLFGPLCDPHDVWGYTLWGQSPEEGDVLAVVGQGAYSFSSAWRFIKAIPPYVVWDNGKLWQAKRAETFRNRYAGCELPCGGTLAGPKGSPEG